MHPPLRLLVLVWVPFLAVFAFASPSVIDAAGDSYPHVAFHVLSLALLVPAVLTARSWLPAAPTRTQRVCTRILLVTVPLAVLGNLVELAAAVLRLAQDGWESLRTPGIFEEGVHLWAANLTVPSLMVSMLAAMVLVIAHAVQGRRVEAVR